MRQKNSRALFDYWNRVRNGRAAPRRDEIEPSDIRHLLLDTFILEVSGTLRTISYRLAGTRLCAAFGRELKGYGFLGHWDEADCFEVAKLLSRVYRDFQPTILVMRGFTESGKQVDYEMIALPLEPMADGSIRILGIATADKEHFWLGTEPLVNCKLRSMRPIDEIEVVPHEAPSLAPSLISPESGFDSQADEDNQIGSAIGVSKKVAHLVVHEGGKE